MENRMSEMPDDIDWSLTSWLVFDWMSSLIYGIMMPSN
jgi:hypothetical protein